MTPQRPRTEEERKATRSPRQEDPPPNTQARGGWVGSATRPSSLDRKPTADRNGDPRAAVLKALRLGAGMSSAELARQSGLSESLIRSAEEGDRNSTSLDARWRPRQRTRSKSRPGRDLGRDGQTGAEIAPSELSARLGASPGFDCHHFDLRPGGEKWAGSCGEERAGKGSRRMGAWRPATVGSRPGGGFGCLRLVRIDVRL